MTHFSAAFRGVSCSIFVLSVSACTYIIPDDVSTPRHNIVTGDRHKPVRNLNAPKDGAALQPNGMGQQMAMAAPVVPVAVNPIAVPIPSSIQYPSYSAAPAMQPAPQMAAAPVRHAPAYPPVEPAVEARARVLSAAPAQQLAAPRMVPTENQAFIVGDTMIRRVPTENPVTMAANGQENGRRALVENGAFSVAQASDGLMNVPQRPVLQGPDSASARLGDARRDLEQARGASAVSKEQLNRDVAAEPSVFTHPAAPAPVEGFSPLPNVAPAATKPYVQPRADMAPAPRQVMASAQLTLPPPLPPVGSEAYAARLANGSRGAVNPVPMQVAAVDTTPPPVRSSARVFDPMAPLPPQAPSLKPIQLTPPGAMEQTSVAIAPQMANVVVPAAPVNYAVNRAPVAANGSAFNPLEEASAPANRAYMNQNYLSPSRYSYTR